MIHPAPHELGFSESGTLMPAAAPVHITPVACILPLQTVEGALRVVGARCPDGDAGGPGGLSLALHECAL